MKANNARLAVAAILASGVLPVQALELYVDTKTQQVFTAPGRNRVRLGEFQKVDEGATAKASAQDANELADKLDQKKAELEAIEARLDKKQASLKGIDEKLDKAQAAAAPAKDGAHVKLGENGLELSSDDGNFKAKIGGRLQIESQVNWNDPDSPAGADLSNGVGIRRARLYTDGTIFKDYEYRFEYDWARNNGGTQGVTDAFLKYVHFKPFGLTIGQQNEGKSMQSVMSNNYLLFNERSLPNNAFIEAGPNSKYQLGITAETYDKAWQMPYTVRGGITTESLGAPAPGTSSNNPNGNINRNAFSGDISYQLVGRGTLVPFMDKEGNFLHTGLWGSWRSINNNYNPDGTLRDGGWQYVTAPDTNVDRTNWANTGNLTNPAKGFEAKEVAMLGAELAGSYGPVHMAAEYMQAQPSGKGYDSDDVLTGYYVEGGWLLTGEHRPYDEKKGTWGRLVPKQNFIFGNGWGAWELAVRFDSLDMNTKNINGGALSTGSIGVNWYLTSHVRIISDWVHVFSTNTGSAGKCIYPATQTASDSIGCFNGLNPDMWQTSVRVDF
jgi:phosphate-selective porin OprO/OprP